MARGISGRYLADHYQVSISSLYYRLKKPYKDEIIRGKIRQVLSTNEFYGHKRIALVLKLNHKRILRVMKKYDLMSPIRKLSRPFKVADCGKESALIPNLIGYSTPTKEHSIWAGDFTYISYQGRFLYLATVIDLYSRQIVGFSFSFSHNANLISSALINALEKTGHRPSIFHSDQGSEYRSERYQRLLKNLGIKQSMSAKASPWQNGYQESYYSQFKLELGPVNRFESLGKLIETVIILISYYNNYRIHTALKMSPKAFSQLHHNCYPQPISDRATVPTKINYY